MPLLELGAIGFVTWVLVYQICVQYLISPSLEMQGDFGVQPRRATGIGLIVVYAIVLLVLLVPWMRLLSTIWAKPDLVPLGDAKGEKGAASTKALGFDGYDAFICDYQGDPLWCAHCSNWKPDRTHHCKELGRCVRRMDHYCPWAGGIIAESTHKWFQQFVSYAAVYTLYVWIVVAVFLSDRNSKVGRAWRESADGICRICTDRKTDGLSTWNLDSSPRCRVVFLHFYLYHVWHDRLESHDQLYLRRSHPTGWHSQYRLPCLTPTARLLCILPAILAAYTTRQTSHARLCR